MIYLIEGTSGDCHCETWTVAVFLDKVLAEEFLVKVNEELRIEESMTLKEQYSPEYLSQPKYDLHRRGVEVQYQMYEMPISTVVEKTKRK